MNTSFLIYSIKEERIMEHSDRQRKCILSVAIWESENENEKLLWQKSKLMAVIWFWFPAWFLCDMDNHTSFLHFCYEPACKKNVIYFDF